MIWTPELQANVTWGLPLWTIGCMIYGALWEWQVGEIDDLKDLDAYAMAKLTDIQPLADHRLRLRFDDGTEGEVDVSDLAGCGVFKAWETSGAFEQVRIGSGGEAVWECGVDLCPDTLYMRLTDKNPEQMFPNLTKTGTHA